MRKLMLAVALAALPVTGFAQSDGRHGTGSIDVGGRSEADAPEYGVEADVMSLTLSQLAEIKTIADGGDMSCWEGNGSRPPSHAEDGRDSTD